MAGFIPFPSAPSSDLTVSGFHWSQLSMGTCELTTLLCALRVSMSRSVSLEACHSQLEFQVPPVTAFCPSKPPVRKLYFILKYNYERLLSVSS